MQGLDDLIILLVIATGITMCSANYLHARFIKDAVNKKFPPLIDFVLIIICVVVLGGAGLTTVELTKDLRVYEPPKPAHLIFWGYAEEDIDVLGVAQKMIKVTNSRVVLFGDAAKNPPRLPNIVAILPDKASNMQTIRMWFKAYEEEIKKWSGAVAVFGIEMPARPDDYRMFFRSASVGNLEAAPKYLEFAAEFNPYGVFERDYTKVELCNFKTTNSPNPLGRLPLKKPLTWSRGL